MEYFRASCHKENTDDDLFVRVNEDLLSKDKSFASHLVENSDKAQGGTLSQDQSIMLSKVREDSQGSMQEGGSDLDEAKLLAKESSDSANKRKPEPQVYKGDEYFFDAAKKDHELINQVLKEENLVHSQVIEYDKAIRAYDIALAGQDKQLIIAKQFEDDGKSMKLNIHQIQERSQGQQNEFLLKLQDSLGSQNFVSLNESVYYFAANEKRGEEIKSFKLMEYNTQSQEKQVFKDTVSKELSQDQKIDGQDIMFVENKTKKIIKNENDIESQEKKEITELFVALTDQQGTYTIRKIQDLNKPLFVIEFSEQEKTHINQSIITFSSFVNTDGQDVILFKSRHDEVDKNFIKGFINKQEIWSEIKVDQNKNLDEQVKLLEQQSKTKMSCEISNNRVADNNQEIEFDLERAHEDGFLKVSGSKSFGNGQSCICTQVISKNKKKFGGELPFWFKLDFKEPILVKGYTIETANDRENRDAKSWELSDEYGNQIHEVENEPTRNRFAEKGYTLQNGGVWCKQILFKVRESHSGEDCQMTRFKVLTNGNNSKKLIHIDYKHNNNQHNPKYQTQDLTNEISCQEINDITNTEVNENKAAALYSYLNFEEADQCTIIEDQVNKKIKVILKEGPYKIKIKTYKTNQQYQTFLSTSKKSQFDSIEKMKKDEFYPFKKSDEINQIEIENHIEVKSSKNNQSVKLQFSINGRYKGIGTFYSSEVQVQNYQKSINIIISVNELHKESLLEYKLRWQVDSQGNFLRWEDPQFLGHSQVFGLERPGGQAIRPFISQDKIEGLRLSVCIPSKPIYDFSLPNLNELDYEFRGENLKSTVKKLAFPNGEYIIMSIIRFSERAIAKFNYDKISVLDQYCLLQVRHELNLNICPQPTLRSWLYKPEPSILQPMQSLDSLCQAFFLLSEPNQLKQLLYQEKNENQQKSIIRQMSDRGLILGRDENSQYQIFTGEEVDDSLSEDKLQVSKHDDFYFHQNFATMLSICFKGTLGEKSDFLYSLEIILEFIVQIPTKLNKKIIQSDFIMLAMSDPELSIQNLFETKRNEESDPMIIFIDYSLHHIEYLDPNQNHFKSIIRKDDQTMIGQQFLDEIKQMNENGKQNRIHRTANQSKIYYQSFSLHNIRQFIRGDAEDKPINEFNFGALVSTYVENYPENLEQCDKIKSIIDYQFENKTIKYLYIQFGYFVLTFVVPFFILAYADLKGAPRDIVMFISLIGALGMYTIEIMAMRVEGVKSYFREGWNYFDQFTLVFYLAFCAVLIKINNLQDEIKYSTDTVETDLVDLRNYLDLENLLRILKGFLLLAIWIKLTWFQKLSKDLGLLQQLLLGVFGAVMPFLVIYLFWVSFFAIMANMLGANQSNAAGYTGIPLLTGYFLNTFENSLGNINQPTIGILNEKGSKLTFLDHLCVYLIYIFWWLAQIVLLVVLLNFVIALISQYYEDVMNSAVMHRYIMRQQLNKDYFTFQKFMVEAGLFSDNNIDAIFLFNGEEVENAGEWKGLTQTMKRVYVKENDQTKLEVKQQVDQVRNQVNLVRDEINLVRDDQKQMKAQLNQITTLIQQLGQRE